MLIKVLKLLITIFQTCMIVYTSESVPTNVRPQFLGICVTFGRLAVVLIPFFVQLKEFMSVFHPQFYYGLFTGIATVLIK